MKKVICLFVIFMMQISVVHADSYCVMIGGDNTVTEEKDMNKPQSVASISKIMTAVVAIEEGKLDDTWKVGKELKQAYGSMIYLKEGQKVSLRSLLYGLMLRSGNDAAVAIATRIAGSEKNFVKLMNAKAEAIGMSNTTFHNASGLDESDGGNISTAYDMALLMSYAMKNKDFRKITSAQYYTSEWNYRWKNKNRLLFDYPFTNGGKTGFTKQAGRTLVTTAHYGNVESVVVTLRASDDFEFHKSEHQKVFENYEMLTLLKKGTYEIDGCSYTVKQPINVSVKKGENPHVRIKTHKEKKNVVVEVQRGAQVDVYTYPYKKVKRSTLFGAMLL